MSVAVPFPKSQSTEGTSLSFSYRSTLSTFLGLMAVVSVCLSQVACGGGSSTSSSQTSTTLVPSPAPGTGTGSGAGNGTGGSGAGSGGNNQNSGTNCGPPKYPCSRSDTEMIIPLAPPQLGANPNYYGGHLGAGIVAIDPAYGNYILRVTDGNTEPAFSGRSFNTSSSAEKNVTSYDESLFFVHDEGNRLCLFQFDSQAVTATKRRCFVSVGGDGPDFGYTAADNRAIYTLGGSKLFRFVVDTAQWQLTADPSFNQGKGYFDFDDPTCLNGQVAANHWYIHDRALSSEDNTEIASIGPAQDRDPYIVVWNAAKGCQWLNVQTWQVSRGWNTGLSDPISIAWTSGKTPSLPGGVHNVQIDRGGAFGILTINQTTLTTKVFWTLGTNFANDTCVHCTSHWACDYGVCFWDFQYQTTYDMRSLAIPTGNVKVTLESAVPNMDTSPALRQWDDDEHVSHANASPESKNIYLVGWQPARGQASIQSVWDDEITGINWDGTQRTIRFNKNWNSGYGGFWSSARCQISRQGHYALCGSDYQMYNLDKGFGNGLNQDACDHTLPASAMGTNGCRTDVLLFELR